MAQENNEIKALGNIIPSMSLNKHINGVPNYSLHEAINMRMSDDRMTIQNIEEIDSHETIMNYLESIYPDVYINPVVGYIKGYKILYILPCNNELILFVWNKSLAKVINPNGSKCVELIRYNEKTNAINVVYSALTYYEGKYIGDYTYNVNNELIIFFCEFDGTIKNNVKTINLDKIDLNINEDFLVLNPKIKIPKIIKTYNTTAIGYSGWYTVYIQYKIDDYNYTKWYQLTVPLLNSIYNTSTLFNFTKLNEITTNMINIKSNVLSIDNTINSSIGISLDFTDCYYEFMRLGIIVSNKTNSNKYITDDISCIGIKDIILNVSNFTEEDFDITNNTTNYYNVKNIINYKNRIYFSNYNTKKLNKSIVDNIVNNILLFCFKKEISKFIGSKITFLKILVNDETYYYEGVDDTTYGLYAYINILSFFCLLGDGCKHINYKNNIYSFLSSLTNNIKFMYGDEAVSDARTVSLDNLKIRLERSSSSSNNWYNVTFMDLNGTGIVNTNNGRTIIILNDLDQQLCFISNNISSDYIFKDNFPYYSKAKDYYDAFINGFEQYTNIYHDFSSIGKTNNTSLAKGEIYDFYIHFVDKYGEITDGYRINNNFIIKRHNSNEEIALFCVKRNIYAVTMDKLYSDLIYDNYTGIYKTYFSLDDDESMRIYDNVIYVDCLSLDNNDIEELKNYFNVKYVKTQQIENINFPLHYLQTGACISLEHEVDDSSYEENVFMPFGRYIYNNKAYFMVPLITNIDCLLGLYSDNINIPDGYVGYFISHKIVTNVSKSVGIAYTADRIMSNNFTKINLPIQQLLNNSSFNVLRLLEKYHYNNNNKTRITKINSYNIDGIVPLDHTEIILPNEPSKENLNKEGGIMINNLLDYDYGNQLGNNEVYLVQQLNINNLLEQLYKDLYKISQISYDTTINSAYFEDSYLYENTIIQYRRNGILISNNEIYDAKTDELLFSYENSPSTESQIVSVHSINFILRHHNFNMLNVEPTISSKNWIYVSPINNIDIFKDTIGDLYNIRTDIYQEYDKLKDNDTFDNNILFTNIISDESLKNSWRNIDYESYKYITTNKGKIVKLFVLGESIFIHCEQAIYILQFKDYLATTEESLQITQSSIKDISYKELLPTDKGYAGLQDKDAAIIGSFGYIFYENDTYRILRLDNGQLMYIDYPILQWLQKYKPYEVRFANDVEHYNLLIQFKYIINDNEKVLIMLYDYILNSFVSILNSDIYNFTIAYNTKNKLYLLKNIGTESYIKCFNDYKFEKHVFDVLNKNYNIKLTNKLSFVYNINYNAIKYLESIMFKGFKYIKSEDPTTNGSVDFTNDPIETIRIPFCGDYIRIYNENIDTGWIDIKEAQDKDNYNNREHYELPYYYLGNWMMNMFRNVKDRKNDINYSKFNKQDYTEADDRARLYGNYFIIEFGFNMNDSKYSGEKSDKFEFQSIEINVSQQFLQQ